MPRRSFKHGRRICELRKSLLTSVQKKQWNKICKSKKTKTYKKSPMKVKKYTKKEKKSRICEIPVDLLTEKQREMRAKKC
jgi:hypothetical protein